MQNVILITVDTLAELADLQMNGNFLCRVAEDGNVYRADPEGGPAIKVLDENTGAAAVWGGITGTLADQTDLQGALDAKQATLVSATNIKTVNGSSLLGAGDLTVSSSYTLVATLGSDLTTGANTTLNNVTGLVFTYAANSIYRIHLYGAVSAAATTTGNGFAFDLSTAVTSIWFQHYHQLANAGTLTGGSSVADAASIGVSSGVPVSNAVIPVFGSGLLRTGANTGTAQLQFRSEVAAAVILRAGTTIVVEDITIPL